MIPLSAVALTLAMFSLSSRDEPKPFLVVGGSDSQVVVDVAKFSPSNSDNQRTIKQLPARGIACADGSRLAYTADADDEGRRELFVMDLAPGVPDRAPHLASEPTRNLDLIGWTGRRQVLIRDRKDPKGDMLRIVGARLPKDSTFVEDRNVTSEPGVYKHTHINATGEVVYFSPKANDTGSVVVWSEEKSSTLVENVDVSSLCWSPNGRKIAIAQTGTVTIFDRAAPGKPAAHKLLPAKGGQPARIGSMAWRPDGQSIALLPDWHEPDNAPRNPRVWSLDVNTGACTVLVQLSVPAASVRWLLDTGCDTTMEEACKQAVEPIQRQRP